MRVAPSSLLFVRLHGAFFFVVLDCATVAVRLLCMDTSYLHWTRNNTERERVILLVMVWHPDITPKEQRVLEYLDCLIRTAVAGKPLPLHPPAPVGETSL